MSFFLCLSVPNAAVQGVRKAFDPSIYMIDATTLPIGVATRRNRSDCSAFLLLRGSSSASLAGAGALPNIAPENDKSALLIDGLIRLFADTDGLTVCLLLHWMHSDMRDEEVSLVGKKRVQLDDLSKTFAEIQEDVLYVIPHYSHVGNSTGAPG